MKKLVLVCLLLFTTVGRAAVELPDSHATQQEVAVLRAQLEQSKHFDDMMISTVWGALSVIGVVSALLIGINFLGSKRTHDQDKKQLQEEIRKSNHEAMLTARKELRASNKSDFDEYVNQTNARLVDLRFDLLEAQRQSDVIKNVPENALDVSLQMLQLVLDDSRSFRIDRTVALIKKDVEAIAASQQSGGPIITSVSMVSEAITVLDRLTGASSDLAKTIKPVLLSLKTM